MYQVSHKDYLHNLNEPNKSKLEDLSSLDGVYSKKSGEKWILKETPKTRLQIDTPASTVKLSIKSGKMQLFR